MQELHDLLLLGPLDLVFLLVLQVVLNGVPQIGQRLVRHQLRREGVVHRRQNLLLDFVQRHGVIRLLARDLRHGKLGWKWNLHAPGLARFHSHDLRAKLRQEILRREMQPEFFTAMQILTRLRHDFTDGNSVDRASEINHGKISHGQRAIRDIDEIRRLIAQTLDRSIDLRLAHLGSGQLHLDIFVFRKLELRRGHDRGAKTHRTIVAKFHVAEIVQRNDAELLLRDRLVIALRNQRFGQLVLNLFAKALVNHRARRFARPITGNLRELREAVRDHVPFFRNFFGRQFDLQCRNRFRLFLDLDLHERRRRYRRVMPRANDATISC